MKDEERGEQGKRMDGRGWVGNGKKKENTKRTAVEYMTCEWSVLPEVYSQTDKQDDHSTPPPHQELSSNAFISRRLD